MTSGLSSDRRKRLHSRKIASRLNRSDFSLDLRGISRVYGLEPLRRARARQVALADCESGRRRTRCRLP
jgi:hypothetical protein